MTSKFVYQIFSMPKIYSVIALTSTLVVLFSFKDMLPGQGEFQGTGLLVVFLIIPYFVVAGLIVLGITIKYAHSGSGTYQKRPKEFWQYALSVIFIPPVVLFVASGIYSSLTQYQAEQRLSELDQVMSEIEVGNITDEELMSTQGVPMGIRINLEIKFPKEGVYHVLPELRVVDNYYPNPVSTGEGMEPMKPRYGTGRRAFYINDIEQLYEYSFDFIPTTFSQVGNNSYCSNLDENHDGVEVDRLVPFHFSLQAGQQTIIVSTTTTHSYNPKVFYDAVDSCKSENNLKIN